MFFGGCVVVAVFVFVGGVVGVGVVSMFFGFGGSYGCGCVRRVIVVVGGVVDISDSLGFNSGS